MNKTSLLLLTILMFFISFSSKATGENQSIVISEIMYNPPESGSDSLEFIELYNHTDSTVQLFGYSMQGVTHSFGNVSIDPGEYFVIAGDSISFINGFGFSPDAEWQSNALANGGEVLMLLDPEGDVVDSLFYDDTTPWPLGTGVGGPNGGGASIELIDLNLDNTDGNNWVTSIRSTGMIVNGREVFASPGIKNASVITSNNSSIDPMGFTVYPNPVVGDKIYLHREGIPTESTIQVIDEFGSLVNEFFVESEENLSFPISDSKGIYFIVLTQNDKVRRQMIVRQ